MATTRLIAPIAGHLARIALGAVFLAAGILKALDPVEFTRQVVDYRILGPGPAAWLAPLLIAFEIVLGTALLAGFRVRASAVASAALLAVFIGIEAYGIAIGRTESCGCFGAYVQRTPGQVIVEDLVLLALAAAAGWLLRTRAPGRSRAAAAAVTAGAVLALGFTLASPRLPLDGWVTRLSPGRAIEELGLGGSAPELARGRHLVALLDVSDPGAAAITERLNHLAGRPGMPEVVALTPSSEEETTAFMWSAVPAFDIRPVERPVLKRLYRDLPRFFLVDSGRVVAVYGGSGPPPDDLLSSEG